MSTQEDWARRARAARVVLALPVVTLLLGTSARAQDGAWTINEREYFERPAANVFVFSSEYNGLFFDEKTAGIELILHEARIATGGAVRLKPTPEQWDQIPKVVQRKVDRERHTIEVWLRHEDFDFTSRVVVTPQGEGVVIAVHLDQPVPAPLEGRAGLNLEFLPSKYFERTYLIDGRPGILPRHPAGPTQVKPADTQVRQFEGYSTFDDRGRKEYVEPAPMAVGRTLVLAPDDPERHVTIRAASGDLQLLDGRNVAQNGWFVVRSLLPPKATGKVAEWFVLPHTIAGWKRTPVVGFSQVGYHPSQKKVAIIELDRRDTPLGTASIFEVTADGTPIERLKAAVQPWGPYLRYSYATADFSAIDRPGLYFIQYGAQKTAAFPIGPRVYDDTWHLTQDVWFPVQMDHMKVNEAYRVWHGAPHLDDARQAPVNIQHFDGYRMGPTTETRFAPGERIPGLDVGGWFDAGDFDVQTGSHSMTILHMVETWERFKPMRDETFVDQATRFVDIHRSDGKPDILQQIEHGTLAVLAQHRAFGRGVRGIVDPHLHQYHHLGDAMTQTDNLVYDASLKPYESPDGRRSGTPDDRWAFTARTPSTNFQSIAALAAASRALRGYNEAMAEECLAAARKSYAEERELASTGTTADAEAFGGAGARAGAELGAVLQLMISTREPQFVSRFEELIWPALDRGLGFGVLPAVRALPHLGPGYATRLQPYIRKYRDSLGAIETQNPYGVPIGTGGWAGNSGVISWAATNYYLHKAYPDLFEPELVFRGIHYILGRHPSSNVSFVSGVGTHSKTMAYGNNRADFGFIAGGVVPGVLILKPDFPEHMLDWPFLWGENEYTINIAAHYLLLAHAVQDLLK
jgi:hypothetical protein